MVAGCKNCGAYFTTDELARLKPPLHAWRLTAAGARLVADTTARGGDHGPPCPQCGHATLRVPTRAAGAGTT